MNQELREACRANLRATRDRLRVEAKFNTDSRVDLERIEALILEFDWKVDREQLRDDELRSSIQHRVNYERILSECNDANARIAAALERIASAMEKS